MSQFTGKVVKRNLEQKFGWIEYGLGNEADVDQIYFVWDSNERGELPDIGASVTFTREPDPEKEGSYIARKVKVNERVDMLGRGA
ncbi:MAG: hypothetical protein ACRER8_09225 [Pseudomonas sp.]|uniref:hypothetical protein n=1 Tax=Pseudomonas sp. TaxID=306 RepID=UPI003D6F0287